MEFVYFLAVGGFFRSSLICSADETRVDCLKAMIIGPEGTPYENGCFVFDIFLPLEYNFKSPAVKSMTTSGGRYRYNPNLYADGVSRCGV
jgi:ubiquitin-protein ligase